MSDRPNVIYILGDDQRHDLLGAAGHPILRTPHLDQLAAEGTIFSNAFCTSPLCTPSRVSHYLGQWERKHGVNFNSGTAVSPEAWAQSFPMRLKDAGYYTGWVGKNHTPIGTHELPPSENGYESGYMEQTFDYWYGNHGHSGFYPKERENGGAIYRNAAADTQPEVFAEGVRNFLAPDPGFLSSCESPLPERDTDRPFCLCVTFNLPHGASTGTMQLRPEDDEIYKSLYRDRFGEFPLPATYHPWTQGYQKLPRALWDGVWIPQYDYVKGPVTLRERMVRQCQTVTGVDRFVGQLRDWLRELNLADNTIIVFSTDHGIHYGEHGIGGKVFMYEEDLRIPMIVHDPHIGHEAAGQRRDELVLVEDLAPTILELCGMEPGAGMQGSSLAPILRGERPDWREAFFAENLFDHQNYPRCECVRTDQWKYIRYFARSEDPAQAEMRIRGTLDAYDECRTSSLHGEPVAYEELYDLTVDPNEEHSLAEDPAHAVTLGELRLLIQSEGLAAYDNTKSPDTVEIESMWAGPRK